MIDSQQPPPYLAGIVGVSQLHSMKRQQPSQELSERASGPFGPKGPDGASSELESQVLLGDDRRQGPRRLLGSSIEPSDPRHYLFGFVVVKGLPDSGQ